MKSILITTIILSGCAAIQKEWDKIPPGVIEYCDRRANEEGFKAGRSAIGFVICDKEEHCVCHIKFNKISTDKAEEEEKK